MAQTSRRRRRNHGALKYAHAQYKIQVSTRVRPEIVEWIDSEAVTLGVSRSVFLGYALEEVREAVRDGRLNVRLLIESFSGKRKEELEGEWEEVQRLRAEWAAQLAGRYEADRLSPRELRAKRENDAYIAAHIGSDDDYRKLCSERNPTDA